MAFENYNSFVSCQTSNFAPQVPEIYSNSWANDTSPYNEADEISIRETLSGRTYIANSQIGPDSAGVYTPESKEFCRNYQDDVTKHNIHNFNTSESYQFTNGPCSSKQQYTDKQYQKQTFEEYQSKGVKTFCAGNVFATEENGTKYNEKSTYCRALFNNNEFVFRTLAKNARLQRLVKKLMMVRRKQKDDDIWNNYINELKNRHGHTENERSGLENWDELPPERIEDYYDVRQSYPCDNLLNDFYTVPNIFNRNLHFKTQHYSYQPRQEVYQPYTFENQSFCYPTSSQSRIMMLNKERKEKLMFNTLPPFRNHRGNIIFVDKDSKGPKGKQYFRKIHATKSTNTIDIENNFLKNSLNHKSLQTEFRCLFPIIEDKKDDTKVDSTKERYRQVSKNVEKLKRKLEKSNTDLKQNVLNNIESKLNNLIQTLNTFMVDVRSNSPFDGVNKSVSVSGGVRDNSLNELHAAKSRIFGVVSREEAVCHVAHENSSATSTFSDAGPSTRCANRKYMKIDKILNEELDKSNKVKRDIEDIMYQRTHCPRAVQIDFDIPTKERSTAVTDPLPKANDNDVIEEIRNPVTSNDRRMTIAVNTDPLGLLGLLRVSSEAVKQILSYMPHIDYYSYLSMLQFRQSQNGVSHFVCNICGASFERPSQLSDHIQSHNLGYSRDCCVCRHVLDMKRHRPGLFKCKYCGQRFTRAYCCELHEESCARRLGVPHDISSRLNLLQ